MKEGPSPIEINPADNFSPKDKFSVLLNMFGNEKAKEAFIEKCRLYHNARISNEVLSRMDSENYSRAKVMYSDASRSNLHNSIMDTITRLATETKNPTPVQEAMLRDFHSREIVAEAIRAFIRAEQDREYYTEDDEEDDAKNKKDMSGPAYFHNLSKGL